MSRKPAVGFYKEDGKTRPITKPKPKRKRTRVVKRIKAEQTPFDTCKQEAFRLHESLPGSQVV